MENTPEIRTVNLRDLSMTELKAMGYDMLAQKEQADTNLARINQEIMKRTLPMPVRPPMEPEENKGVLTGEEGPQPPDPTMPEEG